MISLLLTAYKEKIKLNANLRSIFDEVQHLDFSDYEIIIAIDCDEDMAMQQIVYNYIESLNIVMDISTHRRGKIIAMSEIFQKSKGDIIVFLDCDVEISKGSINKIIQDFKDENVGVICCNVQLNQSQKLNLVFKQWAIISFTAFNYLRKKYAKKDKLWFISGNMFAAKREVLTSFFPIQDINIINDDAYLGFKLLSLTKIRYNEDIIVYNNYVGSIKNFITQKKRIRIGFYQLQDKYGINAVKFRSELILLAIKVMIKKFYYAAFPLLIIEIVINIHAFIFIFVLKKRISNKWKKVFLP